MRHHVSIIYLSYLLIGLLFVTGCGNNGGNVPEEPVSPPGAAELTAPANNEACLSGVAVNDIQSKVSLSWSSPANATHFSLVIRNLKTANTITENLEGTSAEVSLTKGEPYSWYVISRSDKTTETAQSDTWQFYLSGNGITSHPPFPATVVYPVSGSTVNAALGPIYLEWTATDVDDDIAAYDVYLDKTDGKTTRVAENHTATKLENVSVDAGSVYYWRVIAKDAAGNSSTSGIYSFRTQ